MAEVLSVDDAAIVWRRAVEDVNTLERRLGEAQEHRARARAALELAIDQELERRRLAHEDD